MAKKLQVFVSSTFLDLKEERQAAVAGILLAGHIPAGMELFTAGDEAQMEVIKRWIRESDVYMLILGARYGTLEPKSGKSYTQLEYEYAAELGKPSFAVVMSGSLYDDRKSNPSVVESPESRCLYDDFRAQVLSKISSSFENNDQIKLGILGSLRDIADRPNLMGWVRASEVPSVQPLVAELSALQAERDALKVQLAARPSALAINGRELAGIDDSVPLSILYKTESNGTKRSLSVTTTWRSIFHIVSPFLYEFPNDTLLSMKVAKKLFVDAKSYEPYTAEIDADSWGTVKIQFEALGLTTYQYLKSVGGSMNLYWHATEAGKQLAAAVRVVYKA